jgi:hypothetical protein
MLLAYWFEKCKEGERETQQVKSDLLPIKMMGGI